jgi:hypothetical protein
MHDNTPQPTSDQPPKLPRGMKLFSVVLAVLGILILLAITVGVRFYASTEQYFTDCDKGRLSLFSRYGKVVQTFDGVKIVPDQPDVKAKIIKQDGDCVDSLPTVFARKIFIVNENAAKLYARVNGSLKAQGYVNQTDTYSTATTNPCASSGNGLMYSDAEHAINIAFVCAGDDSIEWSQRTVTEVVATTPTASYSPADKK